MPWLKKHKKELKWPIRQDELFPDIANRIMYYDPESSPLNTLIKRFPTLRQLTLSRLTGRKPEDFIP